MRWALRAPENDRYYDTTNENSDQWDFGHKLPNGIKYHVNYHNAK